MTASLFGPTHLHSFILHAPDTTKANVPWRCPLLRTQHYHWGRSREYCWRISH